jgi:hypothetical protein
MRRMRMAAKLAYRFWHSTGLASNQQTVGKLRSMTVVD